MPQDPQKREPPTASSRFQRNTTTGCCHPAPPAHPTHSSASERRPPPPAPQNQQRTAPAHLSALARINNRDCHPPAHTRPPALDFEAARTHRTRPHTCASLHCCPPFIYPCTSSAQRSLFAPRVFASPSHRTAPHTHPPTQRQCMHAPTPTNAPSSAWRIRHAFTTSAPCPACTTTPFLTGIYLVRILFTLVLWPAAGAPRSLSEQAPPPF